MYRVEEVGRTEGEVESLCGEVPDDVGRVAAPERDDALFPVCSREAVHDTLVRRCQTTLLDLGDV